MSEPSDDQSREGPQQVRSSHIGALVPANVARGVFSTGVAVLQGNYEFIVDFLLQMQQPQQVVARVIMPPPVVGQFLQALGENITKYESRFGAIVHAAESTSTVPIQSTEQQPEVPPTPSVAETHQQIVGPGGPVEAPSAGSQQPRAEDLYDNLRLPEDVMTGQYANAVMIGHSASEFSFDFIATFYPRSAVAQRVFLSAPNVPRLRDSLAQSYEQFRRRAGNPPQQPPPTAGPGQPENN